MFGFTTTHTPTSTASYATILRSSAIMGGSFAIVVVLSFIRMKVIALLLGPAGVGLIGIFSTILDLCVALASVGIHQSGVRQIAAAPDTASRETIAMALLWLSLGLGVLGALAMFLAATPISQLTFGSQTLAPGVALLSLAALIRLISGGQLALIQGLRRIGTLAQINIVSAVLSTAICVPLIYVWREQAVVPAVVAMAGVSALVATTFALRTASFKRPRWLPIVEASGGLLHLGLVFMASTLLTTGAAYLARIIILRHAGIDGAGLYQAAWAVGVLYSGFILQAMGSDFYPRLSGLSNDNAASNRLVNEQIRVSILLAVPGVIATIALAQLVMHLFYAAAFEAAATTLRWISLGTFLQILAWPVGFILLAKGSKRAFFGLEAITASLQVVMTIVLVPIFGHEGAGMAFCLMYLTHILGVTYFARRASGFCWDRTNVAIASTGLVTICAVFAITQVMSGWAGMLVGMGATAIAGCLCALAILQMVPAEAIPAILRPLVARLAH